MYFFFFAASGCVTNNPQKGINLNNNRIFVNRKGLIMNTKYKAQIDSVLHYVNQQIGNDWSASASHAFNKATQADVLARIACMSVRNFQLYFKLYLNESFGEYIDRVRRELALQLIAEGRYTSTQIAERIGYANDTALYNVLDKKYSLTPSQYRQLVRQSKSAETQKLSCSIRRMQETPVIFLSFIGDYNNYSSTFFEAESWDKLYTFALSHDILPEDESYWGICYDTTEITDPNKCRFYACMTVTDKPRLKVTDPIKYMQIPAGEYAVFTHVGPYYYLDQFYEPAIQSIPEGYQLNDGLILEHYLDNEDRPVSQYQTEVWIPIQRV